MNNSKLDLVYFSSRPFFLGIIYSLIINLSMQDAIISSIIGTLIGVLFIYIIRHLNLNNKYSKIILLLIYLFFIIISSTIFETFTTSFFLTNTPKIIIIVPSIIICLYSTFKSDLSFKRVSFILFIISIFMIGIYIISLLSYFNIQNLFPFFISKDTNLIKASLIFAILSSIPNLVLYNEDISLKEHIISYLFTSLINIMICCFIIAVLTPYVAKIYSFPEYMVAKRIKLFDFIENVENIFSILWYLDLYVFMVLTYKRLYEIINNKKLLIITVFLVNVITTFYFLNNYKIMLFIYQNCYYILFLLFTLLLPFFKKKKSLFIST